MEKRFYLTYEELKQVEGMDKLQRDLRFYLTYEELKQDSITATGAPDVRFYLTYEELKQITFALNVQIVIKILSYL